MLCSGRCSLPRLWSRWSGALRSASLRFGAMRLASGAECNRRAAQHWKSTVRALSAKQRSVTPSRTYATTMDGGPARDNTLRHGPKPNAKRPQPARSEARQAKESSPTGLRKLAEGISY